MALIFVAFLIVIFINILVDQELDSVTKNIVFFIIGGLLLLLITPVIGAVFGNLMGKRVIDKEDKYIEKMNPYIYYRKLPNDYGIGVTSLLIDSTIENYKDIVAVILDLCAKKYLSLVKQGDKYVIKILKGIDENLFSNEKYIISLLLNNNIKNIDYEKWYNYCVQDGIDLGVYYHIDNKIDNSKNNPSRSLKKIQKFHILLSIIATVFVLYNWYTPKEEFLVILIIGSVFIFGIIYIVLTIPINILSLFIVQKNVFKQSIEVNYINKLNNRLIRTKKGIEELQKLLSFKAFIK